MLSQRLRELEQAGLVRRRKLAPPAGSRVYELTERGLALEPIVLELGRWGSQTPFPEGEAAFSADSFVIALRTLFDPEAAEGLDVTVELRLGEDGFRGRVAEGRFEVARGGAERPDAVVESAPGTLAAVLWHDRPLAEALRTGDVEIDGQHARGQALPGRLPARRPRTRARARPSARARAPRAGGGPRGRRPARGPRRRPGGRRSAR